MRPEDPAGREVPSEAELEAIRASEPDPLGLMDVIELIAPQARVTGWHRIHGGAGSATHLVDVTMPSGSDTAFVLRRYLPEVGQDADVAIAEARTLEALRGSPVRAPEVLWLDAGGAVFDRPALAVTRVPGRVRSVEAGDPQVVRGLAEALVSLRWAPVEEFAHLPGAQDPRATLASLPDDPAPSDLVDTDRTVTALLDHAEDVAGEPPVLSHGDFRVGNVLFDGARVSGIVDWAHARIADPRADVAHCALDLTLLAGPAAGRALLDEHAALRGAMADEAWWRLRAATRALPDPVVWLPPWPARGVDVTADQVRARFVAWVDEALDELTG